MKKPIIAIDIDDTLYEHFGALAQWYNKLYGTQLTLANNHPKGEGELEAWKVDSIEEAVRRVHGFYETVEHKEAVPYDEAVAVMPELAKKFQIVIVTARDTILEEFTHQWLKKHFAGLYDEVHFTSFYSLEGKSRSKQEVLEQVGASYLIDDSLPNCQAAIAAGAVAILFGDYPWNATEDVPAGATRCRNWNEIARYFGV